MAASDPPVPPSAEPPATAARAPRKRRTTKADSAPAAPRPPRQRVARADQDGSAVAAPRPRARVATHRVDTDPATSAPTPAATHDHPTATTAVVPSFARAAPNPARAAAPSAAAPTGSARALRVIEWLCDWLPPTQRTRARGYLALMGLERPVGALLLLWPTLWALWFAALDFPPVGLLVAFTLGVFVVHALAGVGGELIARRWPGQARLRQGAAAARVGTGETWLLGLALALLLLALLAFTGSLALRLAPVGGALALAALALQRLPVPASALAGLARSWPIVPAFAAVKPLLPPLCWLLLVANVLLCLLQDSARASAQREADAAAGVRSLASVLGDAERVAGAVLIAAFVLAVSLAGLRAQLHWPWFAGVLVAALLLALQWWRMRAPTRAACLALPHACSRAGFVLWFGLLFAFALR